MGECPQCHRDINSLEMRGNADVTQTMVFQSNNSYPDYLDVEINEWYDPVYSCPKCGAIITGDEDKAIDFLQTNVKEKKKQKEDKEQWQRRQMGRNAMDTPNLDYSILSKNAEKKPIEPKKETVQIVRKASLNTKNQPRLPRLIVERKKVVLDENEGC